MTCISDTVFSISHSASSSPLLADLRSQNELLQLIDMVRPTTLDAFNKKWIPQIEDPSRRIPSANKDAPAQCIICADGVANATLKRSCSVNELHFNCEGQVRSSRCSRGVAHTQRQECSCGAIMCVSCLVHHFWNQSEEGQKSYARCPHCRAEYCPLGTSRWVGRARVVSSSVGWLTSLQTFACWTLLPRPRLPCLRSKRRRRKRPIGHRSARVSRAPNRRALLRPLPLAPLRDRTGGGDT